MMLTIELGPELVALLYTAGKAIASSAGVVALVLLLAWWTR